MNIISEPPAFITCHFCHAQMEGSHVRETSIQYACTNHLPLRIDTYCFRKTYGEWFFNDMAIYLPEHFKLWRDIKNNQEFKLLEWKKDPTFKGYWNLNGYLKTFPVNWVLSQSDNKLLFILKMYQTFL